MMRIVEDYLDKPEWVETTNADLRNMVHPKIYEIPDPLWVRYKDALEAFEKIDREIDEYVASIKRKTLT
jgi:hypothetical protein